MLGRKSLASATSVSRALAQDRWLSRIIQHRIVSYAARQSRFNSLSLPIESSDLGHKLFDELGYFCGVAL